MSAALFV